MFSLIYFFGLRVFFTHILSFIYRLCWNQGLKSLIKPCCLLFIKCPTLFVGGNTSLPFIFPPSFLLLSWYFRCFSGCTSFLVWAYYHARAACPDRARAFGLDRHIIKQSHNIYPPYLPPSFFGLISSYENNALWSV